MSEPAKAESSEARALAPASPEASRVRDVTPRAWPPWKRVAFRWVFAFGVLYFPPFPLDALPVVGEAITKKWNAGLGAIVAVIGHRVLGLQGEITAEQTGSGDTLFTYVWMLLLVVLSGIAAAVWSRMDRRRLEYAKLDEWLRVVVRYSLASAMFGYGFAKVFKAQFPAAGAGRLLETYGESSPMGLLWTFMGYSTAYTFFAGAMEVTGGLLLLFRRTTTLGALVVAGVMTNVVMLNFCFDVPVKLYSAFLLAQAIFLAAPDAMRLVDVLVLHRATEARAFAPHFEKAWTKRAAIAAKVVYVGFTLFVAVQSGYQGWREWGDGRPRHALEGAYDVESFARDGEPIAEKERWRRVAIGGWWIGVHHDDGTEEGFAYDEDDAALTLTSKPDDEGKKKGEEPVAWRFTRDGDRVTLEGTVRGRATRVTMKRAHMLLEERGFHWVQATPFNR